MDKKDVEYYKPSLKQSVKWYFKHFKVYCYTSFIGGTLMFSLLYIFTSVFKIHYLFSLTLVYIIITINAFLLNRFFVFKLFNPKKIHKQYSQFFIVSLIFYLLNSFFLYVLVEIFGFWYLLAQLIIGVIGFPVTYLTHKHIVFSHI